MTDSNDPKPKSDIRRISARDRKQKLGKTRLEFGPLTPRDALPPQPSELPEDTGEILEAPDEAVVETQPVESDEAVEAHSQEPLDAAVLDEAISTEDIPESVETAAEEVQEAVASNDNEAPEDIIPFEFEYPPEWRGKNPPAAEPIAPVKNEAVAASAGLILDTVEPIEIVEPEDAALDPDTDALLSQIEDDTAAMRAITAEEEQRAARKMERYPPLPAEAAYAAQKSPKPAAARPPHKRRRMWPFNLFTLLFALGGCGLLYVFMSIWNDPFSTLNPLPPLTPIPIVVSQTPTPSLTPIPTDTPTPTLTFTPSNTPEPSLTPTETPVPGTPTPFYAFTVPITLGSQQVYITNPEQRGGCQWSSIAGSVSDINGGALNNYQIRILGDGVDETLISGTATGYGPGGFELPLGFEAKDARFAVQLLDPNGTPVSDVYTITTSSRCDWNISVVRFTQQPAPQ